uniref:SPG11 vesicle trafficking associated, spatacsin n=1 Tax=Cynoglossus semilaevis TaxID=244447 RepID=A0A3P8X7B3_CYNSE
RGLFIPDELEDLQRLLWRLAQGGGVMATAPSLPRYRSSQGLDLHALFITFCLDHGLQYLLYTYLQHHLTPRNCPPLSSQSLSESQPWFEMMVKIQEITRDLTPALIFQASLTSAQVLLPGSQASLSSLLLEGHSLLALAAVMFAPGGIDQRTVDPQLLKMALAPHSKLKAALFPTTPRGHGVSSDISIYHLLQSLHPLDPSRLFGWQTANTISSTTSELPHFSSPQLVQMFALVENLDFLYYLRHGRPSFAYATFLVQQLNNDCLALQNFHVASVTSAAVCFCELLGVCSLKLRVDVRAMNTVLNHWNSSYEASQEWTVPVQFCQLHSLDLSSVYPAHCAQDGHYIHFLLFVQLHSFPPQQVRKLAAGFGPALQAHLSLVFQDLHVRPQAQRAGDSGSEDPECLSTAKASGSGDQPRELFQVLLQSQDQGAPCRFLRRQSLLQRCPTLAGAEPLACLCVWVLTSVDDVTAGEATTHLIEPAQHTEWTLQDLSIIWKTLLGRGQVRPLLQGFQLFLKDCPLVLMLSMFDLCCDYRNFSEAKEKLLDFQRTLITLPLPWVEAQASVLLLTLLERCSSRYDLHHLLQLLADVDVLFKSNPDFRMLSQLSQLLQDSDLTLSPRLLQCTSPSVQQEEFQATVDALQARGRYTQARQVAELAGLPLLQEVNSFRSKPQWRRLETRVSFWKKCQEQLKEDGPQPGSAAQFFLSQAELLDTQERCLLLGLAAHWLSLLHPPPVQELQSLEERQWRSRVQLQLLTTSMERQSVFNLPGSNLGPDVDVYRALVEEFSFSHISALNTDNFLSTDGLPAPVGAGQQDPNVQSALTPEEREVLLLLVGQLLDQGSVHEASRVCRYFGLHHPDLWLVLRCRGLASGELRPQPGSLSLSMLSLPEDQVVLELQRLVDRCRHGATYCKQVLSLYRLSKQELQISFSQVSSEEPRSVLEALLQSEQPERFRKAQVFIRAQGLSPDCVAQLVCSAVTRSLLTPSPTSTPTTQELQTRLVFRPSEGRDSLIQLIRLCEDPNLVGARLMEELGTVSLRDLSCVELLIVAHDCFSLTCNMEGIVRVLQAARHLSHAHLAPGEHYSLLVRLLTGVGRYTEMTYVFDLLHQNHRFEMLLRKKVSSSLKTALLDYIKRCLPADSEKYNMVALCFSMRREIGENHEMAARTQLKMIESQPWDWCVRQATRCVRTAKLVSLQLHFLNQGSDVRVINLRPAELLNAVVLTVCCYQVFVVSEAYSYSPDWAEILHQKVVLKGDFVFLEELRRHRPLTSSLFEDVFKVKRLLSYCDDVYTRYRLAYQRSLNDVAENLLQDVKTSNYLNDRLSS